MEGGREERWRKKGRERVRGRRGGGRKGEGLRDKIISWKNQKQN